MTTHTDSTIVKTAEDFVKKYATLAHDYYHLPLVRWAIATHTWQTFDCFPYLVITAFVKRAGKTRMMELQSKISANGRTFSPDSTASMFRALKEDKPAMFLDEAEKLNQENHPAREFLNKGYKRGQTITRFIGGEVVDFECYGPKCFVLIGDVYDTLRDRSIMVTMRRRTPVEAASANKYRQQAVDEEAGAIRAMISQEVKDRQPEIEEAYAGLESLSFLNDRDEEIWAALFSVCKVFCPSRMEELTRAAVDIATEKTTKRRSFHDLLEAEEKKADDAEDQILLLRDMIALVNGDKYLTSADLIERLKAIPTSKWRMYKGEGLNPQDAAFLLENLNIRPKSIRVKSGREAKNAVKRGYMRADLLAAAKLVGLK